MSAPSRIGIYVTQDLPYCEGISGYSKVRMDTASQATRRHEASGIWRAAAEHKCSAVATRRTLVRADVSRRLRTGNYNRAILGLTNHHGIALAASRASKLRLA